MIHIAICDDERSLVDSLTELIRQYEMEKSEEIKVTVYYAEAGGLLQVQGHPELSTK